MKVIIEENNKRKRRERRKRKKRVRHVEVWNHSKIQEEGFGDPSSTTSAAVVGSAHDHLGGC